MAHEINITRDFGHPWTREKGWDLLEAEADSAAEMDALIKIAERKFWNTWIRDSTAVVMYKPAGVDRRWECRPSKMGHVAEIVWL